MLRWNGAALAATLIVCGASAALAADRVGETSALIASASQTAPASQPAKLNLTDPIYRNATLQTNADSALEVRFLDGSRLSMGAGSTAVVDQYIYAGPDASGKGASGTQVVKYGKGLFRFISGTIPKDQVKIETPTVTIGIRGTELIFDVADDGETEMSTVAGEADATDGSGETLTVRVDESVVVDRNRRFRGRVRKFRHKSRSIAIAEGLDGARKRWRIRKVRQRRVIRRRRRRDN